MPPRPLLLRARTVVPDPASSIDDGAVLVHGDRVARVGRFRGDLEREPARVVDLGEVALLPGLVNAHAHLDLSDARGKFEPTGDFLGWILRIKPFRDARGHPGLIADTETGARELLAGGCTLVADSVADPAFLPGLQRAGIRAVAYLEVIELGERLRPRPLRDALEAAARVEAGGTLEAGLGPHTPYTCSDEALVRCAREARARGLRVSIHVAETEHEVAWLLRGEGVLAGTLRDVVPEGWRPPGRRPLEHLDALGFLGEPRLLVHANHLSPAEVGRVRESGSAVAHCPGSHAFFGHGEHPVAALVAGGVTVAVGTDSLASHPDGVLSIPNELRRLAAREPSLSPRDLLAMATVNGAEALGLAGEAGALMPGAFADAAAFAVPGGWRGPESILDPGLRCTATFVGGALRGQNGPGARE